ncbi:immunoglobulin domain protein [Dictyocaulus viviparus]|uniref:Immunoglobulin domain protein n=1 Tax=Dictyocaulus viviparus TaxID=29172 RepID=A0A0D8XW91_DICVI|nr:immunoglobulin domain protein [Dictyocaulus viviparus]
MLRQDVNLTCNIESVSPFTLYWMKGNEIIGGPFFYQFTDTAVWTLPEVTPRDHGEYYCVVVSDNGNHTVKTFLDTRESPPVIITPSEATVQLGYPAFLHCQTLSSSKVDIKWMRHGVTVLSGFGTKVYSNGTLRIHQASREDGGDYECQAQSVGGITSHKIHLKFPKNAALVLQLPKASVSPSVLYFVPHTSFNISCYIDGDPRPQPHWFYNGREIYPDAKYFITFKNDLIVRDPLTNDTGVYECRAISAAGSHSDSATVYVAGTPQPTLRWFRNGREILQNSDFVEISGTHFRVVGAQDTDAGTYSCVAENIAGRDIGITHTIYYQHSGGAEQCSDYNNESKINISGVEHQFKIKFF